MSSSNPEHNLTPIEIENLNRLEAVAQHHLGTYLQVGNAFGEIRDRQLYRDGHPSFEAYVRERWGINVAGSDPLSQTAIRPDAGSTSSAAPKPGAAHRDTPCQALARACEETLAALAGEDRMGIEIRLAVRRPEDAGEPGEELLPTLRWLLNEASRTIGEVARELESRAADINDGAREQLRHDVLVLDGELAVVKALLLELIDWDSELTRLLRDELPPLDADTDPEDAA